MASVGLAAGRAHAATPVARLNIDVTVNASASVKIDTLVTSSAPSGGIAWTGATRSYAAGDTYHSTAAVTNDGNLTEHWYLTTAASSLDIGSQGVWTLNGSSNTADVGPDQFSLMAAFASSATTSGGSYDCPGNGSPLWTSTATMVGTGGPIGSDTGNAYGARGGSASAYNNFVDTVQPGMNVCPDNGCASLKYQMFTTATAPAGSGKRILCWDVILPPSTSKTDSQIIPLIVTAAP